MADIGTSTLDTKVLMRGTTTQKTAYTNPTEGTLFYDETLNSVWEWNGTTWQAYGPMTPGGGGTGTLSSQVQGNVAHDSPNVGNPVGIGGVGTSATPASVTAGDRVNAWFGLSGQQIVGMGGVAGTSADGLTGMMVPLTSDALSRPLYANPRFNGAGFDRERNNVEAIVLASAARAATTNSADQTKFQAGGLIGILNATANPGGGETLSLKLQAKDSISGNYVDMVDFGVLLTAANGTVVVVAMPGVADADFVAAVVGKNATVSRTYRWVVTHSAAGSWTYSVSSVSLNA